MNTKNRIHAEHKRPETAASDGPDAKPELDTDLRLDGEDDALYNDGLDVDTDAGGLAGTHGATPGVAKP